MRLYYNFKKLYSQVSIFSVIASGFGVKEKNVLFLGYKGINSYVHFSCCWVTHVTPDSLQPHGLQHIRLPCPSPSPRVCSNSCPLSWWRHPTISSSVIPFSSYPQSFPASGSFPQSWLFSSGGQSIGVSVSASVLPIQGWSPLGLTSLISLLSKGLSRVFPSTMVWRHQFLCTGFFMVQLSQSSIHYWKNHSFDYKDLCQLSDVSAFQYAV